MNKGQILETHENYQTWLESLRLLSLKQSMSPYAPGKWSPNEIVMHLAEWDRFIFENQLPMMKEDAELEPFPLFKEFNARATTLAANQTFEETIAYAKKERQRITLKLEEIEEDEWDKEFCVGEQALSIRNYFIDFSEHDEHHKRQVELVRVVK